MTVFWQFSLQFSLQFSTQRKMAETQRAQCLVLGTWHDPHSVFLLNKTSAFIWNCYSSCPASLLHLLSGALEFCLFPSVQPPSFFSSSLTPVSQIIFSKRKSLHGASFCPCTSFLKKQRIPTLFSRINKYALCVHVQSISWREKEHLISTHKSQNVPVHRKSFPSIPKQNNPQAHSHTLEHIPAYSPSIYITLLWSSESFPMSSPPEGRALHAYEFHLVLNIPHHPPENPLLTSVVQVPLRCLVVARILKPDRRRKEIDSLESGWLRSELWGGH